MSLAAPVDLTTTHPQLRWRRQHHGLLVIVHLAGRPPLRITPAHPVLTHAGWRRADLLVAGMHLVSTTSPGLDAETVYDRDRDRHGEHRLPTDVRDFRGDGDRNDTGVVCLDEQAWPPEQPWCGNEGHRPAVDSRAVTHVLDALCTLTEFKVATWAQACDRVPGLAELYPSGPIRRHDGIGDDARRRLGPALAALPDPPLNRLDLGQRLLGVRMPLQLTEVTAVDIGPSAGIVHDVTTAEGCYVAGGVVVGS